MRLSRRTNTIILWIVSLGLLIGMVITFTPSLGGGNLFGSGQQAGQEGTAALLVNGEPISELDLVRFQQQNQALSSIQEGQAAADIELLLLDSLIEQEVLRQAAASVRVSSGEVRTAVEEFRVAQGVDGRRNDAAYLRVIGNAGYDDQGFRDLLREQLRLQSYQDELLASVEVTDAEAEAFYQLNDTLYRSEERIVARMIVVDDEIQAAELRERVEAGESFAEVARENSLERADRAGALGAPAGSEEPQPVGRAALPTAVSNAAFAIGDGGLTDVIEVAGRYYLVAVEELREAEIRPLAEVVDRVREDALSVKQQQVLEAEIARLREAAVITTPEQSLTVYNDEPVARVGDVDILSSDLVRATYSNPQIQQSLNPQNAELITQLFKPSFLQNLIDLELAYQGSAELDAEFLGSRQQVAQAALTYITRDAEASDEEIASYYEENLERFTVAASADVTEVGFDSADAAGGFRAAVLAGLELESAAEAGGGSVVTRGIVGPGVLPEAVLDTVLFATDAFEPLPDSALEVSDVLVLPVESEDDAEVDSADAAGDDASEDAENAESEADPAESDTAEADSGENEGSAEDPEAAADGAATEDTDVETPADAAVEEPADEAADAPTDAAGEEADTEADTEADGETVAERFVVLVAERTPERVRSLDEVRDQVEASVLAAERSELRSAWLDELRERIPVEDLLTAAVEPPAADDTAAEDDAAPDEEVDVGEAAEDVSDDADDTVEEDGADADGDGAEDAEGAEEEAPAQDGN